MYLVIDIGSNTIRAVVFHLEGEKLTPVLNKKYSAGLAGYVQPDGTLSREGLDLCIDILSEIRILIDTFNFNGIYPFATASLRNISNSSQVLEEIQERCGLQIQVLTGKEEAFFDYYGASCQLTNIDGVLVDIGGGSTEILIYKNGKPQAAESINIGSLNLYNNYVNRDGVVAADTYSARAGHSEHQSGLAFDVNTINDSFANTEEGKWLNDNCYKYGFILRYPNGKSDETGYQYEPWHFRYVGVELAEKLYNNGNWITVEDYFGITSRY